MTTATPTEIQDASAPANGVLQVDGAVRVAASSDGRAAPQVSASVIDRRRAQQLIDRAFNYFDEGAANEALLACRQAVSLSPRSPQAHSLLGLMMERQGDVTGAIDAYEKVIALDPNASLERDSLQRLRATQNGKKKVIGKAAGFDFDDNELFDDLPRPEAATPLDEPVVPVAIPAVAVPAAAGVPVPQATPLSTPARTRRPARRSSLGTVPAADVHTPADSVASPFEVSFLDAPTGPLSGWQRLIAHPSYFYQGIPLLIAALLSLLFLGWAQQHASVRYQTTAISPSTRVSALPEEANPGSPNTTTPGTVNPIVGGLPGPQGENPGQPYSIGNGPEPAAPSTQGAPSSAESNGNSAPAKTNNTASNRSPRRANTSGRVSPPPVSPRPLPERIPPFPITEIQPAIPPTSPIVGPRTTDFLRPRTDTGLTSPITEPRSPDPVITQPISGETRTTEPAEPRRPRGTVTITSETLRAPETARPNTPRFVDSPGWQAQSDGLNLLESGRYERAISNFRRAINEYQKQIRRGQNVAEARAGIQACRSGIRTAQSQME